MSNFETAFGGTFAKEYHKITDILTQDHVNIGGFELNLTYHDETKIEYLKVLKEIAKNSSNAKEFKEKVKAEFPEYSGLNYLDMTAGFFFSN